LLLTGRARLEWVEPPKPPKPLPKWATASALVEPMPELRDTPPPGATLIRKIDYAQLKNRSPAAVSNWIRDGALSPPAIVGHGQRAKIWLERADADLARNLGTRPPAVPYKPIERTNKVCVRCGEIFIGTTQQRLCSAKCRREWNRITAEAWRLANPGYQLEKSRRDAGARAVAKTLINIKEGKL
jgi:ribosomal protein S27AE